jgi:hypothetical protein
MFAALSALSALSLLEKLTTAGFSSKLTLTTSQAFDQAVRLAKKGSARFQ